MQHSAIGFYNVNAVFFVRYEELKYSTIHLQFSSKCTPSGTQPMPGAYSNQRRSYGQLTQYSRNFETLTVAKLVNKLPVCYGPRIRERSTLILTSHQWPEIWNSIFPPGFPTKFWYAFLVTPGRALCPGYVRSKMKFANKDLVRHTAVRYLTAGEQDN